MRTRESRETAKPTLRSLLTCFTALLTASSMVACGSRNQPTDPTEELVCDYPTNVKCGETCIDVLGDRRHCGECGHKCAKGEFCVEGLCADTCGKLTPTQCGDQCVNLRTNRDHCGDCGRECKADKVCSGGICADTCGADTPYTCGNLCVNMQTDKFHCGRCGNACGEEQLCVEGRCEYSCKGTKTTECHGTCVDPRTDPRFCGDCNADCKSGERCQDGTCESSCTTPTPADCNGVCADLQWDTDACGKCGVMCGPDSVCNNGQCANTCSSSREKCGDRCADLLVDPYHCGRCGNTCGLDQVCSAGTCTNECGGETPLRCGHRCLRAPDSHNDDAGVKEAGSTPDASVDDGIPSAPSNDCRLVCPEGAPDTCPTGCVDHATDLRHCGECGRRCNDGEVCTFGVCEARRDAGGSTDSRLTSDAALDDTRTTRDLDGTEPLSSSSLNAPSSAVTGSPPDDSTIPTPETLRPQDVGFWGESLAQRSANAPFEPFTGCAELEWLDDNLVVRALSSDGNTLGGNVYSPGTTPESLPWGFRWSRQQPIEWIASDFLVVSLSLDGSIVTGLTPERGASLWRANEELVELDRRLGMKPNATGMTSDGAFVIGRVNSPNYNTPSGPFRWSVENGFEWLPVADLSDVGPLLWDPAAISDDGKTIVGRVGPWAPNVPYGGVFWREGAEMQLWFNGDVRAVSRDGSVAVGDSGSPVSATNGLIWHLTGTVIESEVLPLVAISNRIPGLASVVSADGTVVFGVTVSQLTPEGWSNSEPYVWTRQAGTRLLAEVLATSCIDVSTIQWDDGWQVKAISDDNKLIVVCNRHRCWIAQWD